MISWSSLHVRRTRNVQVHTWWHQLYYNVDIYARETIWSSALTFSTKLMPTQRMYVLRVITPFPLQLFTGMKRWTLRLLHFPTHLQGPSTPFNYKICNLLELLQYFLIESCGLPTVSWGALTTLETLKKMNERILGLCEACLFYLRYAHCLISSCNEVGVVKISWVIQILIMGCCQISLQ